MKLEDFLQVYQRDEKYLVLNPRIPSWIVTNLNGVILVKTYAENPYIKVTSNCNLNCIYCFATKRIEGNKIMNFNDYKKVLDSVNYPTPKGGGLQLD